MSLTNDDKLWITDVIGSAIGKAESSLKAHVDQRMEQTETALLTAFHKWASPVEIRLRSHHAAIHDLDTQLEALAERVANLEATRQ